MIGRGGTLGSGRTNSRAKLEDFSVTSALTGMASGDRPALSPSYPGLRRPERLDNATL
jgi:hypothetical protein